MVRFIIFQRQLLYHFLYFLILVNLFFFILIQLLKIHCDSSVFLFRQIVILVLLDSFRFCLLVWGHPNLDGSN